MTSSMQENNQTLSNEENNSNSSNEYDEEMEEMVEDEQRKLILQNKLKLTEDLMDNIWVGDLCAKGRSKLNHEFNFGIGG
jgi:hypothetical protein